LFENILKGIKALGNYELLMESKSPYGRRAADLYAFCRRENEPDIAKAAAFLKLPPSGVKFQKAQEHLLYALLNNVSMLRPGSKVKERAVLKRYIWKLIAIGKRQAYKKISHIPLPFLKEAFFLAEKAGMIAEAKFASEMLVMTYARGDYPMKEYLFLKERFRYYQNLFLEFLKLRMNLLYLDHFEPGDEDGLQLKWAELEECRKGCAPFALCSLNAQLYLFELKLHEFAGDTRKMIDVSQRALDYVDGHSSDQKEQYIVLFESVLSTAFLLEGEYSAALDFTQQRIKDKGGDTLKKCKFLEQELLLLTRLERYEEAYSTYVVFERTVKQARLKKFFVETLSVFGLYLPFLVKLGKVQVSEEELEKLEGFSIKRSTSAYHRLGGDEEYSYHFNLLHALQMLIDKKYTGARRLIGQINYRGTGAHKKRFRYFKQLLDIVVEQGFHRTAVMRHAAKIEQRLKQTPLSKDDSVSLIEVVPFETLWGAVLGYLGTKRISHQRKNA
jgi:hypothetical protein